MSIDEQIGHIKELRATEGMSTEFYEAILASLNTLNSRDELLERALDIIIGVPIYHHDKRLIWLDDYTKLKSK